MGQSVALKLQSLLDVLHLEHILNTFGYFIGIIRICACKDKSGPGPETLKYDILFTTKYTKPSAYMHVMSVVTLHAALENGSIVTAGSL